jgi:gliding motility-associated-like protein
MKVSPDKKYLVAAYERCDCYDELKQSLDICTFNAETGQVTILYTLSKNTPGFGERFEPMAVEFSPDSKLLYITYYNATGGYQEMELYQYDVQFIEDSLQFKQSEIFIAQGPVHGLQLARDGKIYCATDKQQDYEYISVIHKPWERGIHCNFEANAIYLQGRLAHHYLPNVLLDHLYRFEWEGECARHPIAFQPNFLPEPSSILWNFGDFQSSTELWPVHYYQNGGEYEVHATVTYPNGRIEETSRVITILDGPDPDLGPDQWICEGEETELIAGDEEGLYAWSTGAWGQNVFSVTVSDSGTYWVRITNEHGCMSSDTVHVGFYDKAGFIEDSLIITPTACGGSSGSIEGLVVEGTEPLAFEWYDGDGNLVADTLDIYNLAVNNYYLHILDGNGCETVSEAYTITDAGDIEISGIDHSPGHCGQENGFIEITATTGSGTDLLYSIDNGTNWQSSNQFADLPAGSYFIKVSDQVGCEAVYENNPVEIGNIPGPEITSVSTTPENDYLSDGSIDIEALIGSGDLYFSIDDGGSFQTNDGFFENLSAGTYTCVVKDDFGCDTSFTVIIDRILSQVIDAIAGDGYTCIGDATASQLLLNNFTEVDSFHVQLTYDPAVIQCDGYIQVHPDLENGLQASMIPALGEVHITWKGETPTTLPPNAKMLELVFSGLEEGVSQVDWIAKPGEGQFFNANGEEISVNYELGVIRIYTRPEIQMGAASGYCEGDTIIIWPQINGASGDIAYLWEGPDNYTSTGELLWLNGIQKQQGGTYQLTVTDTLGCTDQKTITLIVNDNPVAAFHGSDTLVADSGYILEAGGGAEYYLWNTGDSTESIEIYSEGMYIVEMESQAGCMGNDSVYIVLREEPVIEPSEYFYIPNAFTPNGDGRNDVFRPIPASPAFTIYNLKFTIYDRWGAEVFETDDIGQGWDGMKNGRVCQEGVYVYRITFKSNGDPSEKIITGTVAVIK